METDSFCLEGLVTVLRFRSALAEGFRVYLMAGGAPWRC